MWQTIGLVILLFMSLAFSPGQSIRLRDLGNEKAIVRITKESDSHSNLVVKLPKSKQPNTTRVPTHPTSPSFGVLPKERPNDLLTLVQPAEPAGTSSADTITYTYDSLNRLTSVTYASGGTINYAYDAAGNRTSIQIVNAPNLPLAIDSVAGLAGRTSGAQQIRLTGWFANLSTVRMGGALASWAYANGSSDVSVITVTTPPHAVGAVQIDLTPVSGPAVSKANAFAYLPTVFTDNTIVVGQTTAKAQHIIELRQSIDALRAVAGLSPAPWTDATLLSISNTIMAIHIQELRIYLDDAATRLGYATQPYTDPALTGIFAKRIHLEELRQRIRDIAQ
jgi:YD repeat-containing protein